MDLDHDDRDRVFCQRKDAIKKSTVQRPPKKLQINASGNDALLSQPNRPLIMNEVSSFIDPSLIQALSPRDHPEMRPSRPPLRLGVVFYRFYHPCSTLASPWHPFLSRVPRHRRS